jgi:hypothetical protein
MDDAYVHAMQVQYASLTPRVLQHAYLKWNKQNTYEFWTRLA